VKQPDGMQLDPAAGEQLRSMLSDEMQQVDAWLARARELTRRAPLGKNPVGEAMAAKFGNLADSDTGALGGVLTPYRQILQETHDAVTEAMKRYQATEARAIESLRKAAGTQS